MASFDILSAASKGYEFIWQERKYLAQVAFPVFFVKLACLLLIFVVGAQDKYLLQGLISMPSFIIEAIFIIGLIRYFLYREPIFIWGKFIAPPKSDVTPEPYNGYMTRKQCVQGGVAIYLLLRVIETALVGSSLEITQSATPVEISEEDIVKFSSAMTSFIMFTALIIFTWIFRLFWLFIPIAAGYKISHYLREIPGIRVSTGMVATWIICSLPLMTMFSALIQITNIEGDSSISVISTSIMKAVAEIVIVSVQVIAMTYGINKILSGKKD